jgi:hypothetical protein
MPIMTEPRGGINVAIYCKECFYSLKGLTTCRCPECGRAFDPDKADSFSLTPYAGRPNVATALNSLAGNSVAVTELQFKQIQSLARRVDQLGEENHRLRKVVLGVMQMLHRRQLIDAAEVDGLLRDAGLLPPELNQIEDLFDPGLPVDESDVLDILTEPAQPPPLKSDEK